jgi:hypothetical protein
MGCRRTVTGDLFRVVLDLVLLSRFFSLCQGPIDPSRRAGDIELVAHKA